MSSTSTNSYAATTVKAIKSGRLASAAAPYDTGIGRTDLPRGLVSWETEAEPSATETGKLPQRSDLFKLVLDTVWWRRVNYFVSLSFVLVAAAFPLLANYLRTGGVTESLDVTAGGSVGWAIESISGFLPRYVGPWITAVRQHPVAAAAVLVGLVLSLRFSAHLQGRISDRARAAWNVGTRVNHLKPTGQRGALLKTAMWFAAFAIGAWAVRPNIRWIVVFAGGTLVFGSLWAYRMFRPPGSVDPAKPGFFLNIARKMQTTRWAKSAYKFAAQEALPFGFLVLAAFAVLILGASRGLRSVKRGRSLLQIEYK